MELYSLDKARSTVAVLDTYESFIWVDRYNEFGDFELYTTVTDSILQSVKLGYYIVSRDSEHSMIVESIRIAANSENGNRLIVTGRSLESILDRRIIWGMKTLKGNLQDSIQLLLEESIISPNDPNRKIDDFIFQPSSDSYITSLTIDAQYTGDNLYDVIRSICGDKKIGFKIVFDSSNRFVFSLYSGVDRTYAQEKVPYVIFSPKFDNIINSDYMESDSSLKNVTLVAGEGEGADRRYIAVGDSKGMERRELFTDARDISSTEKEGEVISPDEYDGLLAQRGIENLYDYQKVISFEGQAEPSSMFIYGEDYRIGDVVQIANEYGNETTARIVETVISDDKDGTVIYPTYKTDNE